VPTTLTRQEMEDIIRQGGSVIVDGRSYATVESLPSEAALAEGDEAKEKALINHYEQQMAQLAKQREDVLKRQADRRQAVAKQQEAQQVQTEAAQAKPAPQPQAPAPSPAPPAPPSGEGKQEEPPQVRQRFGPRKVE
jgi:DNA primase